MRKNKAMRLASALLVLTLLTTCAISSTFAKYVTKTEGSDSARVAYWGFDQDAKTTIDLFSTAYDDTVKSANTDKVIAPGTTKEASFAFGYTGNTGKSITAPEVDYTLTVSVDTNGSNTTELDKNENFVWTLRKGSSESRTYNTLADLVKAIEALSGDESGTKTYKAGTLPSAFTSADEEYTIGWVWKFTKDTQGDEADTAMGNAETLENVALTITITATQVD